MNKTAFFGLLLALFLPLVGYFFVKSASRTAVPMPRHYIYDSVVTKIEKGKQVNDTLWHVIPDFKLTNHLGKQVGWEDMKGRVVVADFFFTHCPTICPKMTVNMKKLQDGIHNTERVGDKTPRFVQFLSFTVDPERDSVAQIKKWADRFQVDPSNWWLLTGPKKEIYDLSLNDMKLMIADGKGIDTSFFHTDLAVLIDRNRNIRGYYHMLDDESVNQLSRDIILLSLEKDPNRKRIFEGKFELIAVVFLLAVISLATFVYFLKKEKK